ncbi:MAG: hypothetical protein GF330_09565 [Candidatus Eisenbacteria bacterium]|nr:hypothetical protein [Candidatus Eisenbacteria bacterium]
MRNRSWWVPILASFLLCGSPALATPPGDDCEVYGDVTAVPNPDDPALGTWKYCLEASWHIDPPFELSEIYLVLGLAGCECVCEEFPFAAQDSAGYSTGIDGQWNPCTVYYGAEFLCEGDPAVEIDEPLVRFTPLGVDCWPEVSGTGVFCFYSDWAPIPVPEENAYVVTRATDVVCTGEVTGVLPECDCGTSPAQEDSWGAIKARFRE